MAKCITVEQSKSLLNSSVGGTVHRFCLDNIVHRMCEPIEFGLKSTAMANAWAQNLCGARNGGFQKQTRIFFFFLLKCKQILPIHNETVQIQGATVRVSHCSIYIWPLRQNYRLFNLRNMSVSMRIKSTIKVDVLIHIIQFGFIFLFILYFHSFAASYFFGLLLLFILKVMAKY